MGLSIDVGAALDQDPQGPGASLPVNLVAGTSRERRYPKRSANLDISAVRQELADHLFLGVFGRPDQQGAAGGICQE
jgi:hypothetical protein